MSPRSPLSLSHFSQSRPSEGQRSVGSELYAPIARYLLMLEESDRGRMRRKFDLCYLMAKEGIAFEKYSALYELEVRHNVELGGTYKTAPSAKLFTHYIAESQRQQFLQILSDSSSFRIDGSTDAGNLEQELVILLSCKDDTAEQIKSYARFFSGVKPAKSDSSGLVKCLSHALSPLGITDVLVFWESKISQF